MNFSFLICVLSLLLFGLAPASAAQDILTVVYTGRINGELEPCGCTADSDMGGVRRLATVMEQFRKDDPNLLLIGSGGIQGTLLPAHRTSNRFLLEGLQYLDYDAIGLHWEDLVYGTSALFASSLPWVVSNWRSAEFKTNQTTARGKLRVSYLQWLEPGLSPYRLLPVSQQKTYKSLAHLEQKLQQLKENSSVTIVGTYGMNSPLEKLPLPLIDILLLPSNLEQYSPPELIGTTWVLRPGSRGQYVAKLSLEKDTSDDWSLKSHQVVALDDSIPDSPKLEKWYEDYTAALLLDFKKRKQRAQESNESGEFAGAEACALCHQEQLVAWHATEHARALVSLREVKKDHDANCLVCHTVGFGQTGGYPFAQNGLNLEHVGCEACHGAGKSHVLHQGTVALPIITGRVCTRCHNNAHSPRFNMRSYWPRVVH